MIAITTHLNADFDCVASMVAARKLHPGAHVVFSGSQEKGVRDFLEKGGFPLDVTRLKNLDLSSITTLVVVDTMSRQRLGPFADILGRPGLTVVAYDHHTGQESGLGPAETHIRNRGACTTMMVELLRERGIPVSREEATLFLLGIYEDTGTLTFSSTRPEDFHAAAWLLEQGGDLTIVSDFLRRNLSAEQVDLLHELAGRLEFHNINGVETALAFASRRRYVGDLSSVAAALKEMEGLSALFVVVEMEGRLHLIARSRIAAVDAGAVAAAFGGGGHATAASAVVRDRLLDDTRTELLRALERTIIPTPTAGAMMTSPVTGIPPDETLADAEQALTRHNFNALPVLREGRTVGLITRQTVEKALFHGMGGEKVSDYMNGDISQVTREAPYDTVKEIIIRQKQKVLPVVDHEGKTVGIIGRADVLQAIYHDMLKERGGLGEVRRRPHRPISRDMTTTMQARLPSPIATLLEQVADCATECGYTAYAVGGFVRDLMMGRPNLDVDVVIEGDGIDFARRFTAKHGGKVRPHKKFKTAIMLLEGRRKVDVATARTEYYTEPAALPIVELSSIKNDLYRRDFTINALAIKLNGSSRNRLIDFFGGQQDLKDGAVRVLHNLSFIEDPTRIFRALRFEQRFHMTLGGQTEKLMKLAIRNGLVGRISGARLFGELNLIFNEEPPSRFIGRLADFGLLKYVHPAIEYGEKTAETVKRAEDAVAWHRLGSGERTLRLWAVFLHSITDRLNDVQKREMMQKLGFMKEPIERFIKSGRKAAETADRINKKKKWTTVELYDLLEGMDEEELTLTMAHIHENAGKRHVAEYMTKWRHVRPKITGDDLIGAGIAAGPLLGRVIAVIVRENLKGLLPTRDDEIRFAKRYMEKLAEKKRG